MARQRSSNRQSPHEILTRPEGDTSYEPTLLRVLVIERHWQKYTTFERQFRRAAAELAEQQGEPELKKATVSPRQFERWYSGKVKTEPYPDACRILEHMFGHPIRQLLEPASKSKPPNFGLDDAPLLVSSPTLPIHRDDLKYTAEELNAREVIAWIRSTNTSDGLIDYLTKATQSAAEDHSYLPPAIVLVRVRHLQAMVDSLLRGGKQRLRQSRELMRLDADLSAHMCQLLGDINRDREASALGNTAIALADEAGSNSAAAFSALAQIARWRHRHADAADLAAEGLKHNSSPENLRVLLAYQEANAAAADGQRRRAHKAISLAEAVDDRSESYSAWSCPAPRRALYRVGIALNLGDPREALRQADEARSLFQDNFPQAAYGTWAHFQICVAKAHLMLGSVDGALQYISPVLDLPAEYRLSTLVSHIAAIDNLLKEPRFADSPQAATIRVRLAQFAQDPPQAVAQYGGKA